jgi:hypothetical protein
MMVAALLLSLLKMTKAKSKTMMLSIFFFFLLMAVISVAEGGDGGECSSEKLVVYRVIFNTFWDRETFPRQYPEWRPPAHWSKLVGKKYQLN